MTDRDERLERIAELGALMLRAAEAMDRQQWRQCQQDTQRCAMLCRLLLLSEQQRAKENDCQK